MKPALELMKQHAYEGGNLFIIKRHTDETKWLQDMGYIQYKKQSRERREGGSASWRAVARRKPFTRVYEITDAGFARMSKEGLLDADHPRRLRDRR